MSFVYLRHTIRLSVVTVCAALLLTGGALAQARDTAPSVEPDPDSVPVLRALKQDTPKAAYDYLGLAEGMHVWLLSAPGIMQMIHVPQEGPGVVVGGTLVDENADPLSAKLQSDFVARYPKRSAKIVNVVRQAPETPQVPTGSETGDATPPTSASEILWRKFIIASPIVFQGDAGAPAIIAVLDPEQDATKTVWKNLQPLVDSKKITLRIMPLALTSPDTIMHISAILNQENPADAWRALMDDRMNDVPDHFAPETAEKLKRTIELATELSLRQTPFFIYRAAGSDDAEAAKPPVQVMRGLPKNWADLTQVTVE